MPLETGRPETNIITCARSIENSRTHHGHAEHAGLRLLDLRAQVALRTPTEVIRGRYRSVNSSGVIIASNTFTFLPAISASPTLRTCAWTDRSSIWFGSCRVVGVVPRLGVLQRLEEHVQR